MTDSPSKDDSSSRDARDNRNIWAPWRMEYINGLSEQDEGCFLCRDCQQGPQGDRKNLVLWRGRHCFVVLNRFPYTGGHSMIAPYSHVADLSAMDEPALLEMMSMLRDLQAVLTEAIHPHGFNVGMNIGRCAGAGLPGHLHMHIVPRWNGDTNFMAVFGDVRVIPTSLDALYALLDKVAGKLGLPRTIGSTRP